MRTDVSYTDDRDVALDVIAPTGPTRRCAVLVAHGGAWRMGQKEFVRERSLVLAAHGFTVIPVGYRLLGAAAWPAQLDDVVAALDWVRQHAGELDVDPEKIVIQGHSAGAHLALLTGVLPPDQRPAAIAAFYPPIGFFRAPLPDPSAPPGPPPFNSDFRAPHWMLLAPDASDDAIRAASPVDVIGPDFPPTVVFHGINDVAVPCKSSVALHDRLTDAGVPAELHLYPDRNHEFDMAPSMAATAAAALASFLDRHVVDVATAADEIARYPFPPAPPAS